MQQIERGKLVVMLNKFREAEAIIPYREQNHREHFHQGEPIRAVLKRVEETPKGPRLILSRADALFVKALFKLEVPEIQQGIVEIRAVAREVGSRTKIAVFSRDDSIDPVGACVGLKGSRVQAVVNELGGERIDIVPWSSDPERFAKLALAPARVARVFSDPATKTIQAVVDEDQLSLAIGTQRPERAPRVRAHRLEDRPVLEPRVDGARRRGAALRAAARGERRMRQPTSSCRRSKGLRPATVAVLEEAGYRTLNDIIDLEREDFLRLAGHRARRGRSHHGDHRRADRGRQRRRDGVGAAAVTRRDEGLSARGRRRIVCSACSGWASRHGARWSASSRCVRRRSAAS